MSPDIVDFLAVTLEDAAVTKRKTKRITGAHDLTAGDKWRKTELEEQKQKRKEEREQKKKEKEARI